MTSGEILVVWTVRVSLLLWFAAVVGMFARVRPSLARSVWTVAALMFAAHVIFAFEFVHEWSHAAAYREAEIEGGFGGGVFASYAFTIFWLLDAAWWCVAPKSWERRPRWLSVSWHAFMAFLIFNATVIFESGPIRYCGLIAFVILGAIIVIRRPVPRTL